MKISLIIFILLIIYTVFCNIYQFKILQNKIAYLQDQIEKGQYLVKYNIRWKDSTTPASIEEKKAHRIYLDYERNFSVPMPSHKLIQD